MPATLTTVNTHSLGDAVVSTRDWIRFNWLSCWATREYSGRGPDEWVESNGYR